MSKCPVCKKPTVEKYKPFCSVRCADIDLGRWFLGKYVVHTDEKPQDSQDVDDDRNQL